MSAYKKGYSVKKQQQKSSKLLWGIIAGAVIVLAVTAILLYRHHQSGRAKIDNTHVTPRPITDKTSKSDGTGAAQSNTNTSNSSSTADKTNPSSNTPNPTPTPDVTPAKPYGSFVSNHKPGQNGSPFDEESVCNTTPNVTCTITFTKDGATKQLPPKTTDKAGSAYWTWTPQSLQLTPGNWTVTAVATSGQQSSSTTDSIALQVL